MVKLFKHKRIKWFLIIGISVVLSTTVAVSVFFYYHPTHFRYNDRFIIGSTITEIVERYGDFDRIDFNKLEAYEKYETTHTYTVEDVACIYYIVKDKYIGMLDANPPVYYGVYFENGDGIATRVGLRDERGG